jgi:ferric-dicitrate binding protein FerR (iron transport regulator)
MSGFEKRDSQSGRPAIGRDADNDDAREMTAGELDAAMGDAERNEVAAPLFAALAKDIREAPAPDLAWERMEAAVMAEAAAPGRAESPAAIAAKGGAPSNISRLRAAGALAAVLAAAAAFFFIARGDTRPPPVTQRRSSETARVVAPERAAVVATVQLISGDAWTTARGSVEGPLRVGDQLASGALLRTAPNASVHARFYGGTGFVLEANSLAALGRERALASEQLVLDLEDGAITSKVDKLTDTDSLYAINAGDYRFRVLGTHFRVARTGNEASLEVLEGRVEVRKGGALIGVVSAPGAWSSSETKNGAPDANALPLPYGAGPATAESSTVNLPGRSDITDYEIDGLRVPVGGAGVVARVDRLPATVSGWAGPNRLFTLLVNGDLTLPPRGNLIAANADAATGELTPGELSAVVRAGQPRLAQCRDLASRQLGAEIVGTVNLSVRINAVGNVERANLLNAAAYPSPFRACVLREVREWHFPRPRGGAVDFTAPLTFSVAAKR